MRIFFECAMLRSVDSDNNQTEETNMSIENAILELAAAIRELAASNVGQLQTELKKSQMMVGVHIQEPMESGRKLKEATADTIEQDVAKVETDAKAAQQKAMDKVSTGKAEIAAALEKAKAEKEAAKPAPEPEDDPIDAAPLDWETVRQAMLAVGKDRDALVKLMGKYEVPKGGKAPAEKWADLLAEANAIVAARG